MSYKMLSYLSQNVYQYCKRNVKLNFGAFCVKISVRAFVNLRLPQPQSSVTISKLNDIAWPTRQILPSMLDRHYDHVCCPESLPYVANYSTNCGWFQYQPPIVKGFLATDSYSVAVVGILYSVVFCAANETGNCIVVPQVISCGSDAVICGSNLCRYCLFSVRDMLRHVWTASVEVIACILKVVLNWERWDCWAG